MAASASTLQRYQQPMWGRMDRALKNCFIGSAILGLAVLIAVYVVPKPPPEAVTLTDVPERLARLILEKPAAPAPKAPERIALDKPKVETPKPKAKPKAPKRRRTSKPKVTPDRGKQGRQKAQTEVTENLAQVTGSLDKVLDNLSKSLPASDKPSSEKKKPRRRRRGVRSGRDSGQLSNVGGVSNLSSADVSSSAIESDGISIATITDLAVDGGQDGDVPQQSGSRGGSQAGRNDYRSNESLLSVVRRYAPGIQFCYDNELKKNPGLRGKLVINLTVTASGKVSEAFVVENTLKSDAVTNCVLAQIRGWQFPVIPSGTTSFKTPFVFTPPK